DLLGVLARGFVERRELQLELGAEVREEAALRHPGLLGKPADREGFEPRPARLLDGGGQDLGAGLLSLGRSGDGGGIAHEPQFSTNVRICQAPAFRMRWKVTSIPAVAPQMKRSP